MLVITKFLWAILYCYPHSMKNGNNAVFPTSDIIIRITDIIIFLTDIIFPIRDILFLTMGIIK